MTGAETFTCCTTPMPWPTRAEDRTCPECGTVWEREPVNLGAGARIKATPPTADEMRAIFFPDDSPGIPAAPPHRALFHVAADLPGLPGVPVAVWPVKCPDCGVRAATVRHTCDGPDAPVSALLACNGDGGCGVVLDLLASCSGYSVGQEVGVLVEAARRDDPRVVRS